MAQSLLKKMLLGSLFSACLMPIESSSCNAPDRGDILDIEAQQIATPAQSVPIIKTIDSEVEEKALDTTEKVVWTQHMWDFFWQNSCGEKYYVKPNVPSLHPRNPHIWVDTDGLLPAKPTLQQEMPEIKIKQEKTS